jgi:hypothetical protein
MSRKPVQPRGKPTKLILQKRKTCLLEHPCGVATPLEACDWIAGQRGPSMLVKDLVSWPVSLTHPQQAQSTLRDRTCTHYTRSPLRLLLLLRPIEEGPVLPSPTPVFGLVRTKEAASYTVTPSGQTIYPHSSQHHLTKLRKLVSACNTSMV